MGEIVFNEDQLLTRGVKRVEKNSALEDMVIRTGLVKTAKGVKVLFIAIIVLCVIGTLVLMLRGGTSTGAIYGNHNSFIEEHPELLTE